MTPDQATPDPIGSGQRRTPTPDAMTPDQTTPVIVAARRTPIGTAGRALSSIDVATLAAPVLRALVDDVGASPGAVDDVILGNCMGPGGNPARIAALAAGLGQGVPGLTIDRQCGSGLSAIALAATMIRAGSSDLVLAGGAESASTAPLRFWPGDPPERYTRAPFAPAEYGDPDMGEAADLVAAEGGISRERQDAYAARSHTAAVSAAAASRFSAEIVPVAGLDRDERPRRGMTQARLARFPAAFTAGGTVTAGNACGVSDGAAAVAVVPERYRAAKGMPGLRILGWNTCGGDPRRPGIGLVPAARSLLDQHGLTPDDLGAVEITEAFAGQVLACIDALGLDERIVCSDGGAIALGHPWGASGAVLVVRLFSRMIRNNGPRFGLAACAIGGGMGVAMLVDRVLVEAEEEEEEVTA